MKSKTTTPTQRIILLALAYVFGYYIFSGSMGNLLAPRLIPFTYFGFAFLTILAVYNLISEGVEVIDIYAIIMFTFFISLVLFIPPGTLNTSVMEVKGGITDPIEPVESSSIIKEIVAGNKTVTPTGSMLPFTADSWQPNHLHLYNTPEDYLGKTATISGFVYKKEGMYPNRLFIGRYVIWCCVADAYPVTVLIETDRAGEFENDDWISVTGMVSVTTVANTSYIYPVIIADHIERQTTQKPYVYFKSYE